MYTSYSIEKIAEMSRREALAAAAQHRLARESRRSAPAAPQGSPAARTFRIPRRHRLFGLTAIGRRGTP